MLLVLGMTTFTGKAFSRLCLVSGRDDPDLLFRDFYSTLTAYEELLTLKNGKRTLANRARQKLARKGVVQCLEDWATQNTSEGLELLVSKKLFDLTGEFLVLKYPDRFSPTAIASARRKLEKFGYSP
jgi:hypothetical protein